MVGVILQFLRMYYHCYKIHQTPYVENIVAVVVLTVWCLSLLSVPSRFYCVRYHISSKALHN